MLDRISVAHALAGLHVPRRLNNIPNTSDNNHNMLRIHTQHNLEQKRHVDIEKESG